MFLLNFMINISSFRGMRHRHDAVNISKGFTFVLTKIHHTKINAPNAMVYSIIRIEIFIIYLIPKPMQIISVLSGSWVGLNYPFPYFRYSNSALQILLVVLTSMIESPTMGLIKYWDW